jgi:hypothetical protein
MKLVARQMMRMVEEINHRLDTIPERPDSTVVVTCRTCHRGVSRPEPLYQVMTEARAPRVPTRASGPIRRCDRSTSAGTPTTLGSSPLNMAAFRLGQAGKFDDAFSLLQLNAGFFPGSSGMAVFKATSIYEGRHHLRRERVPGGDPARYRSTAKRSASSKILALSLSF